MPMGNANTPFSETSTGDSPTSTHNGRRDRRAWVADQTPATSSPAGTNSRNPLPKYVANTPGTYSRLVGDGALHFTLKLCTSAISPR